MACTEKPASEAEALRETRMLSSSAMSRNRSAVWTVEALGLNPVLRGFALLFLLLDVVGRVAIRSRRSRFHYPISAMLTGSSPN